MFCRRIPHHLTNIWLQDQIVMESSTASSTAAPSLASPPFVSIPGLPNFRDAGGYPIASKPGKMVRRGVLFRAAEPGRATDEGIARLQSLGIAIAYDLRSEKEIAGQSSGVKSGAVREWDGCERRFVPVFLSEDYSPEAIAKRYKNFSATGTEVSIANSSLLLSCLALVAVPACLRFALSASSLSSRRFPWQGTK